jgi:rhamnosyltransferase
MDASLFIDSVDHEWCFRAYQRGYSVFIDESIVMRHTVGSGTIGFLGFRVRDTAPSRLYYQFRNQIRLILHYPALAVPRGWRLKRLVALPLKSIAHVLLGDNRRMRLDAIFDGIMAGLRNQTGRRPDTRE